MCGIIGIIGNKPVAPMILDGLRRLEYRGYDSAGIATIDRTDSGHNIDRRRAAGKLNCLAKKMATDPLPGTVGIGHTRWATHGVPSEQNAHPHASGDVAIVHNGIIENFEALRAELEKDGTVFVSDTDTEVIAHLLQQAYRLHGCPEAAVKTVLPQLDGAYALGILFRDHPDLLIGARQGSPLAIGFGPKATDGSAQEMFLGSDAIALSIWTNQVCFLEDGDWAILQRGDARVYDHQNRPANREIKLIQVNSTLVGKGDFRHFMEKEIHEQPDVIADTLQAHINPTTQQITFRHLDIDFSSLSRLTIIACGTSYYAGLTAKYWFEQIARLPVECDVASEYRYREAPIGEGEAALFISQSGETSDTLAALRYCKANGAKILSIVNVPESSIARESHVSLQTLAGPEIGVASTKAMTTQMLLLAALVIQAGRERQTLDNSGAAELQNALSDLPAQIRTVLQNDDPFRAVGRRLAEARDILFLGRGSLYPVAMEGALKLKEISYIHAEGYAAGEMKHGPIALIDEHVPFVVAAPSGALFEKTANNCEEAIARGGRCIVLSDDAGLTRMQSKAEMTLSLPKVHSFTAPILYVVPMQLLAYYTAVAKGTDVDQPRNLAKSVTVE